MEKEPYKEYPEQYERPKFGANVVIRNYWIRHAQKMSGEIISQDKTSVSTSAISERGKKTSREYGETLDAAKHGAKGYVSHSERTSQTLDEIFKGYQKANADKPIRFTRTRKELTLEIPDEFLKLYEKKFNEQRKKILNELGIAEESFVTLSPDKQEEIAELSEEPVIKEWLDADNELAKLFPPSKAAARFADIFNKRHDKLAKMLNSGSEIDLFHITHKAITEPFLTSGVLIRKTNGERVTKLEQLGGSLKTLENWMSEVTTDNNGNPTVTIKFRDEEFIIDPNIFKKLISEAH